jgi:hypothetical protein
MLEKNFFLGKKDCEMVIGYTFSVGYIYRADCILLQIIFTSHLILPIKIACYFGTF